MNKIRVCIVGCTGWTGSAISRAVLNSDDLLLTGAVARKSSGQDIGEALGVAPQDIKISKTLEEALQVPTDVVIDYTRADVVKGHVIQALEKGKRVIIGSSGLKSDDFQEIDKLATEKGIGVIAAGNFSITAALAKHFALLAATYLPSREIIDFAEPDKPDAPSGTTRELAETLAEISSNKIEIPVAQTIGPKESRGATVAGTQIHSIRLPGYKIGFEARFGLPDERLTIIHDAGTSPDPYVSGTLLAIRKVMAITGLIRGMDTLLFKHSNFNS